MSKRIRIGRIPASKVSQSHSETVKRRRNLLQNENFRDNLFRLSQHEKRVEDKSDFDDLGRRMDLRPGLLHLGYEIRSIYYATTTPCTSVSVP